MCCRRPSSVARSSVNWKRGRLRCAPRRRSTRKPLTSSRTSTATRSGTSCEYGLHGIDQFKVFMLPTCHGTNVHICDCRRLSVYGCRCRAFLCIVSIDCLKYEMVSVRQAECYQGSVLLIVPAVPTVVGCLVGNGKPHKQWQGNMPTAKCFAVIAGALEHGIIEQLIIVNRGGQITARKPHLASWRILTGLWWLPVRGPNRCLQIFFILTVLKSHDISHRIVTMIHSYCMCG